MGLNVKITGLERDNIWFSIAMGFFERKGRISLDKFQEATNIGEVSLNVENRSDVKDTSYIEKSLVNGDLYLITLNQSNQPISLGQAIVEPLNLVGDNYSEFIISTFGPSEDISVRLLEEKSNYYPLKVFNRVPQRVLESFVETVLPCYKKVEKGIYLKP